MIACSSSAGVRRKLPLSSHIVMPYSAAHIVRITSISSAGSYMGSCNRFHICTAARAMRVSSGIGGLRGCWQRLPVGDGTPQNKFIVGAKPYIVNTKECHVARLAIPGEHIRVPRWQPLAHLDPRHAAPPCSAQSFGTHTCMSKIPHVVIAASIMPSVPLALPATRSSLLRLYSGFTKDTNNIRLFKTLNFTKTRESTTRHVN